MSRAETLRTWFPGLMVRSYYAAKWTGVVVQVVERFKTTDWWSTDSPLIHATILFDRFGNRVSRRIIKVYDAGYFERLPDHTVPADVNPDWLRPAALKRVNRS